MLTDEFRVHYAILCSAIGDLEIKKCQSVVIGMRKNYCKVKVIQILIWETKLLEENSNVNKIYTLFILQQ